MSAKELPLDRFYEQSVSFCNSIRDDLDDFVQRIRNEFLSINREVKVLPKARRKSRFVVEPSSCTLDLKEFNRSKEDALGNLKISFEEMEEKWTTDIADLKDWIFQSVDSCLSKIQLEIKVSAKDLDLSKPEAYVSEESSSSTSEVSFTPSARRSTTEMSLTPGARLSTTEISLTPGRKRKARSSGASMPAAVKINKRVKTTSAVQTLEVSSATESDIRSRMTDWKSRSSAVEDAPSQPGLYEIKVWQAKSPAYIGYGDDLKKCLLPYSEGISSGKKQLDLFLRRNTKDVAVRYEVHPSAQLAKQEHKKRLKEYVEKYKKMPSYNYDKV